MANHSVKGLHSPRGPADHNNAMFWPMFQLCFSRLSRHAAWHGRSRRGIHRFRSRCRLAGKEIRSRWIDHVYPGDFEPCSASANTIIAEATMIPCQLGMREILTRSPIGTQDWLVTAKDKQCDGLAGRENLNSPASAPWE